MDINSPIIPEQNWPPKQINPLGNPPAVPPVIGSPPYEINPPNWPPIHPPPNPPWTPDPPNTPTRPPYEQSFGGGNVFDLCCIGFNPEDSMLEAVFTVTSTGGIPGGFCDPGMVAHVGFWLTEPSNAESIFLPAFWIDQQNPLKRIFVGESTLRIQKIQPLFPKVAEPLSYVIHKQLTPEFAQFVKQCFDGGIRLPQLDCILTITPYNEILSTDGKTFDYASKNFDITDANFGGAGIVNVAVKTAFIQFPKAGHKGKWEYFERTGWLDGNTTNINTQRDPSTSPIHNILLKNGKVLMFMGAREDAFNESIACLFDPIGMTFQKVTDPLTHFLAWKGSQASEAYVHDVFCSCHNLLADGRLFVIGGQEITQNDVNQDGGKTIHAHHDRGIRQCSIFEADTNSWHTIAPSMRIGRWYPGSVIMGDGRVFVMDGHPDTKSVDHHTNIDLEIFDPRNNSWIREKNNNASYSTEELLSPNDQNPNENLGFFPRLVLLPDGSLFCCNRIETIDLKAKFAKDVSAKDYKDVRQHYARWLPDRKIWYPVVSGDPNINPISPVVRQRYSGTLLPIFFDLLSNPDGAPGYPPENTGVVIYSRTFSDEKAGLVPNKVFKINPLSHNPLWEIINKAGKFDGRWNGNCVILADGTIMFVGGNKDPFPANDSQPNLEVDILDTTLIGTRTEWSKGADSLKRRSYHSVAMLLQDGRVMLAGTEPDTSTEIYSPDYLFRGPRPVFAVTPDHVGYDQFLHIQLGEGWQFGMLRKDRCALIRLGSVTHCWGFDQRYINLFACHLDEDPTLRNDEEANNPDRADDPKQGPGFRYPEPNPTDSRFRLQIPQNPNLVPPGYYMLFLVSALGTENQKQPDGSFQQFVFSGAPSLGHIVRVN